RFRHVVAAEGGRVLGGRGARPSARENGARASHCRHRRSVRYTGARPRETARRVPRAIIRAVGSRNGGGALSARGGARGRASSVFRLAGWRDRRKPRRSGARGNRARRFRRREHQLRPGARLERGRQGAGAKPRFLCRLARRGAERGATVVAGVGKRFDKVYSPAIDDSVIACGFHTVGRRVSSGGEEVAWSVPRFDQSPMNAEVLLIQPAGVLGSSFSAPLVAGFAALMTDRRELPAFCESARLAGLASAAEPTLGSRWNAQEHGAVDAIYRDALLAAPHRHLPESNAGPCPECALLARPAYV